MNTGKEKAPKPNKDYEHTVYMALVMYVTDLWAIYKEATKEKTHDWEFKDFLIRELTTRAASNPIDEGFKADLGDRPKEDDAIEPEREEEEVESEDSGEEE